MAIVMKRVLKPYRVLDLAGASYGGHASALEFVKGLRKIRWPGRRLEYHLVDSEANRIAKSKIASGKLFRHQVDLNFEPIELRQQLNKITGGKTGFFDEIHLHLPDAGLISFPRMKAQDVLRVLSEFMKPGARFYHTALNPHASIMKSPGLLKVIESGVGVTSALDRHAKTAKTRLKNAELRLQLVGVRQGGTGNWLVRPEPHNKAKVTDSINERIFRLSMWAHDCNYFVFAFKPLKRVR